MGLGAVERRQLGVAGEGVELEAGEVAADVAVAVAELGPLLPADRIDPEARADLDALGRRLGDRDPDIGDDVAVGARGRGPDHLDGHRLEHAHRVDRALDLLHQRRRVGARL